MAEPIGAQPQGESQPESVTETGAFQGVYVPIQRRLMRGFQRAQSRITTGPFSEVVIFLDEILARDEDSFVLSADEGNRLMGLKSAVRQLLSALPPEGRAAYELQHAAKASKLLESALKSGNVDEVAALARRFFYTPAGLQAALLLAQMETDRGNSVTAASIYDELMAADEKTRQWGPQLSLLAATSHMAVGDHQRAREILEAASESWPAAQLSIGGQDVAIKAAVLDALLSAYPLSGSHSMAPGGGDWVTDRGNAARNAEFGGGPPHMRPRWRARVANHPQLESYLRGREQALMKSGMPVLPAASPLAIGNTVLFKTLNAIVAVDWNTGKRIWETRSLDERMYDQIIAGLDQASTDARAQGIGQPLEHRVWDDALAAGLSSDGQRVFTIRGIPLAGRRNSAVGQAMGFGRTFITLATPTNRLAAYDLATEGKLVWEINGARPDTPLAGAFFLGPPLAVDNSLYVMAEIRSAVYLLAIDPADGTLQWRQQLVSLERGVTLDPERARAGAQPSLANGILVCPTSAGAVVAVDLRKRSLAWAYLYPRLESSIRGGNMIWRQHIQTQHRTENGNWLDGTAILAGGRALIAPRDSAQLHCLDLESGELAWKIPRGSHLFVACVADDAVILVGPRRVSGIRLSDGKPLWDDGRLSLPAGGLPSGRGLVSNGMYYLPLSTGDIVAIDPVRGNLAMAVRTEEDQPTGNLVGHRGAIISQSAIVVDKFEQLSVFLERTNKALADDPQDPSALRDRAEIALAQGDRRLGADLLRQSYQLAPDDLITRELLTETLLQLLATDYGAWQAHAPLLEILVEGTAERNRFLRLQAEGLQELASPLAALNPFLRIAADEDSLRETVEVSPVWSVRGDRWLRARLSRLVQSVPESSRDLLRAALEVRRSELAVNPSIASRQSYLAAMQDLPGAEEVRLELARELLERGNLRQAEFELLRLAGAIDSTVRTASAALARRILDESGRADELAYYSRFWMSDDAAEMAESGDGPVSLAVDNSDRRTTNVGWSTNQIAVEVTASPPREIRRSRGERRRMQIMQPVRVEQSRFRPWGQAQLFVSADRGNLHARNRWGESLLHQTVADDSPNLLRFRADSEIVHGAHLGRLAMVSLGPQVVALDLAANGRDYVADVLWRGHVVGSVLRPGSIGNLSSNWGPYHHASHRRRLVDERNRIVGSLGPVTLQGAVYQQLDALNCLDPLTGETYWSRSDVPIGCELFGNQECVVAASAAEGTAQLFQMIDGSQIGERDIPRHGWLVTPGCHLAYVSGGGNGKQQWIRILDVRSGEIIFEEPFHADACFFVVEPDCIAVFEPTGRFQLIDAATATVPIQRDLDPIRQLAAIYVLRDEDRLFLCINQDAETRNATNHSIGSSYPLLTGSVYAFDRKDGSLLWPVAATVKNRGLALSQPPECPALIFVSRESQQSASGNHTSLRLLCLDKATGRSLYRHDALVDSPGSEFRIFVEGGSQPSVTLRMAAAEVRLSPTDQPQPPEPPFQHGLDSTGQQSGGLLEIGRRVAEEFIKALEIPIGRDQKE